MRYLFFSFLFLFSIISTAAQQPDSSFINNKDSSHLSYWDSLPAPAGWVNDFENLYSQEEEKILDSIIVDFKNKTTIEMVIVTLDTNTTSKDKFEELTYHIANTWQVGVKGKDNGILIGISKGYRKMRIENGYGITKIMSDEETKNIIDHDFIPSFKEGNYFEGTLKGLNAMIDKMSAH